MNGSRIEIDNIGFDMLPWQEGAFTSKKYRNMFQELGYSEKAIDEKLQEAFNGLFYGPEKVYFEVGDSMAYISDIKNHDVRTEGMSYGMMIAVQWDKKDIFDRLWRWAKKSAAASLAATHTKSREFVERLWNSRHEPYEDGYFDAYYDGLIRLFALMHLSGRYRIIE